MSNGDLQPLIDRVESAQGFEALSEAKRRRVAAGAPEVVTVVEDGEVVAAGVAARHEHADGGWHWAVETVVEPGLAFPAFEIAVLDAILAALPEGVRRSVWSSRRSLDSAATERGFRPVRRLLHMAADLPLTVGTTSSTGIRAIREDEVDDLIAINRAAFDGHREAGALDRAAFDAIRRESWFDLGGIVVAEHGGRVVGFCWTKAHDDGDGEIYRIAVHPDQHGSGIGRRLAAAGFETVARRAGSTRGTLWVDEANVAAVGLYRSLGLETTRINTEYE